MPAKGQPESAAVRRQTALDLRCAGNGYRAIGKQLGVSHVQAFRDVQQAIDEINALTHKTAERVRDLEVQRLDRLTLALWPRARQGDDKAVRALVALMDRRARLLGLDAPTKLEHAGPGGGPVPVVFGGRYRPDGTLTPATGPPDTP